MIIDINNLMVYQEDHRIEAKTAKNQIPNRCNRRDRCLIYFQQIITKETL